MQEKRIPATKHRGTDQHTHVQHRPRPQPTLESPAAFAALGFGEPLLMGLARADIHTPTEIQTAMAGPALAGRDVVGQARTGTGKSIAFALPILQQLDPDAGLQALCLVPTRELVAQVVQEIRRIAHFTKVRVAAVYGGQKVMTQ